MLRKHRVELVGERVSSVEEKEWLLESGVVSGEATLIRAAILFIWARSRQPFFILKFFNQTH
jgi:hypothetical protein